jgi:hypothetical protein
MVDGRIIQSVLKLLDLLFKTLLCANIYIFRNRNESGIYIINRYSGTRDLIRKPNPPICLAIGV